MIDGELIEGAPDEIPHLRGDIELDHVTVRNSDGNLLLEDLSLRIPKGAHVGIRVASQSERAALAEVLTRELKPARGTVTVAGHDLAGLHQSVIAARIGYVQSRPYLFGGTIGDNLLMSLRTSPRTVLWDPAKRDLAGLESRRAGNSPDRLDAEWLDPGLAGLDSREDVQGWWFKLAQAMGTDDLVFRNMLNAQMDPDAHPDLARALVGLRDEVRDRIAAAGLDKVVYRFDPDRFNPAVPLGGNLMFAAPRRTITQESLASEHGFLAMIIEQGLAEQGIAISQTVIETLHQTFGRDGTNHPLFTALGISETLYEQLIDIAARRRDKGDGALSQQEFALLLTVPFALTAEEIGPAFPETFKDEILAIRHSTGAALRARASDMFVPIEPQSYFARLTVLENLLYGRISMMAGLQGELVGDLVADVVKAHGLQQRVTSTLFDIATTIGGANLAPAIQERIAFSRAAIKRPDILIFNQPLASLDADVHERVRRRLGELLPETTQIYLDDTFARPESFDLFYEIAGGRLDGAQDLSPEDDEGDASDDLRRKLGIIQSTPLFKPLDARSQRLLAFAAQWYKAPAGTRIFSMGEPPDAAYLCLSGLAEISFIEPDGSAQHISTIEPGRLIGDLSIILDEPRQLHLTTLEDTTFLRIGAPQFRSVIEHDPAVLLSLLRTVSGHLTGAAELIRSHRLRGPSLAEPTLGPPEPEEPR